MRGPIRAPADASYPPVIPLTEEYAIAFARDVTIERTDPDGLHPTPGYHHVTKVQTDTLIYLAGQCPLQPSGELAEAFEPDDYTRLTELRHRYDPDRRLVANHQL